MGAPRMESHNPRHLENSFQSSWRGPSLMGHWDYGVRRKNTLSEACWGNSSFTVARTGGTALGGASGFFRIANTAKGGVFPFTDIHFHTVANGSGEIRDRVDR